MKHLNSILCSKAIIDKNNNAISFIDVIEEIQVKTPTNISRKNGEHINVPISFDLVTIWMNENKNNASEADIRVELVSPEKKILSKLDIKVSMNPGEKKKRVILHINGLTLTSSGYYEMVISLKDKKEFRKIDIVPIDIKII